jgi:hypothetical protein
MYKLKTMAKRASAMAGAVGLLVGIGTSALPALVSADSLNPLTNRSLTLSSSSPGWSYLDGSGNVLYAPPNSGANGKKTGDTFTFNVSTDSSSTNAIKGMTFQYCTSPAGNCYAPGNNGYDLGTSTPSDPSDDTRNDDSVSGHTSDLNVTTATPAEISTSDWDAIKIRHSTPITGPYADTPLHDDTEGNFVVLVNNVYSTGWAMTAGNSETSSVHTRTIGTDFPTGRNNLITLTNSGTGAQPAAGDNVKVIFFATDGNYITNPGAGAFFVRLNTYKSSTISNGNLLDGGVTVANVMNESISIQTKVLETMDFSVGVKDPDTFNDSVLTARGLPAHGQCNSLLMADPTDATGADDAAKTAAYNALPHNVLKLGDSTAEYSLKTNQAYTVDSYWRLSSNSSGGATVYYTGHTLTNTENDQITPLTSTGVASNPGTEQFGLGIAQDGTGNKAVAGDSYGGSTTSGDYSKFVTDTADLNKAHLPQLAPLTPVGDYGAAAAGTPLYAFSSDADTYAQPIASESTDVVNCVTAKMRYVANIAATTPAGIYTTKINYVASPQY